jgi:hypothetical protein
MSKLPDELKPLTANLPPDKARDIEAAIASSPYLANQLTQALREDKLDHIRMDQAGAHRGGYYDVSNKSIYIGHRPFTDYPGNEDREQRLDSITGTLGHEVAHAFQKENIQLAVSDLSYQVAMKVRNPDNLGTADMTDIVGSYIKASRNHEADAEISGWNAVASRIMTEGGNISRNDVLERISSTTDCIKEVNSIYRPVG